jgi:hypothetical protein
MIDFTHFIIACSTCRETMVAGGGDAAGWSIFFLLGVGVFMVCMARREKAHLDPTLSDDYVPTESAR